MAPETMASEGVDFHAHVYFGSEAGVAGEERAFALALREKITALGLAGVTLGRINEGPRGPHLRGSYEVFVPRAAFAEVVCWLAFHRGSLAVLVHPLTEDEVGDHTARAMWMGEVLPLNLDALR